MGADGGSNHASSFLHLHSSYFCLAGRKRTGAVSSGIGLYGHIARMQSLKNETIMGTIKRGILGGFSGRVGTVVGSTWKEVSYMRALAISVANPRTHKQQTQRGKFAVCLNFLQAVTPYLRIGYRQQSQTCTAFNAAMSYLLRHAVQGEVPDITLDYEQVLVARGSLMPVFDATVQVADGKASFTWTDNSGLGDALATDQAMPLVYNKVKKVAVYDFDVAGRGAGKAELAVPADWKDNALAVYLAFACREEGRVSNSVCLRNDAWEGDGGSSSGGSSSGGSSSGGGGDDIMG